MMRLELPGRRPGSLKRRRMDAVKEDIKLVGQRKEDADEMMGLKFPV